MCCFHWLIKELLWAYSRAIEEQSQVGKLNGTLGGRRAELVRSHRATGNRWAETLLVDHNSVVMHILLEMG